MSPMPYRGEWKDIAPENPREAMRQLNGGVALEEMPSGQLTNQVVANFQRNKGQVPVSAGPKSGERANNRKKINIPESPPV